MRLGRDLRFTASHPTTRSMGGLIYLLEPRRGTTSTSYQACGCRLCHSCLGLFPSECPKHICRGDWRRHLHPHVSLSPHVPTVDSKSVHYLVQASGLCPGGLKACL